MRASDDGAVHLQDRYPARLRRARLGARIALALAALLSWVSSSFLQAQSRPTVRYDTLPGGVVRVTSTGASAWAGGSGWRLELERVIQPPTGTPGELGTPSVTVLLDDGRLLVVDSKPIAMKLFDASGRYLRTIGRDGEGPGEYRTPQPLVFGDSVFFHDYQLARGTIMTLAGQLARTFPTVCCYGGFGVARDPRGRFYTMGSDGTGKAQWVIFTAAGVKVDSLLVSEAARRQGVGGQERKRLHALPGAICRREPQLVVAGWGAAVRCDGRVSARSQQHGQGHHPPDRAGRGSADADPVPGPGLDLRQSREPGALRSRVSPARPTFPPTIRFGGISAKTAPGTCGFLREGMAGLPTGSISSRRTGDSSARSTVR